jgi:hypothetical protein
MFQVGATGIKEESFDGQEADLWAYCVFRGAACIFLKTRFVERVAAVRSEIS